jgi:hypothetical protein
MDVKLKKSWDDITVAQFQALKNMENEVYPELIDKGIVMVDIVYDVDSRNISYSDFEILVKSLNDFIGTKIEKKKAKASYTVNGTKYCVDLDYANFTTSQFIDFTTYKKENDYVGMLSVVLIPEYHKYSDGYDMQKVKNDLEFISVTDAFAIMNFFLIASTRFIQLTLTYLRRKIKRMKSMPREQKMMITSQMKELETIMGTLFLS